MLNHVVEKYNLAQDKITNSHSPRYQLYIITEFFDYLNTLNLRRLYPEFIPDFLKYLLNIFKNSIIEFVDPEILLSSRYILVKACEIEHDDIILSDIKSIIEIINIKLILSYYYLGETENGLIILKEILTSKEVENSGVSLDYVSPNNPQRKRNLTQNTVNPEVFRVSKAFDILRKINAAINRKGSYSAAEVNVMLVESENQSDPNTKFGTIKRLECEIQLKREDSTLNPYIENITDIHEEDIHGIKDILIDATNNILYQFNSAINPSLHQIKLRFDDAKAIYKGSSFSAGAAILMAAAYLNYKHSRTKYYIFNNVAITGALDSEGQLQKLPDASLCVKLEAAFFSWVSYLVIPAGNYEKATEKLEKLKKKYPRKIFELIPINNISELISDKRVIKFETDTWPVHAKKIINRHKGIFYSLLFFVLLAVSGTTIWKAVPRNYKPYPQTTNYMNVIYSPDREDIWKFTTSDKGGMDTIDFGEIALGDKLIHRIAFWNNGNTKASIQIEIEGRDKNDFEVFWGGNKDQNNIPEYVNPDIQQFLYVKFAPSISGGEKIANCIIYDSENIENRLIIPLKAFTGHYKGGYSLHLKDNEDFFTINPKIGNILGNNFSISFWFKPENIKRHLLQSENYNGTMTKFALELSSEDSTIQLIIFKPKTFMGNNIILQTKNKIKLHEWNYLAFSYNSGKYWLILNDQVSSSLISEYDIMQFDDVLTFGKDRFYNIKFVKNEYDMYLADIRIYNKGLLPEELIRGMSIKENYKRKNLYLYYDFEENVGHVSFNKSLSVDANADFTGLPVKSLDVPFAGPTYYSADGDNNCIEISGKGGVYLNKNLFSKYSAFTIEFENKIKRYIKPHESLIIFSSGQLNFRLSFSLIGTDSLKFCIRNGMQYDSYNESCIFYRLDTNWHRYIIDYDSRLSTSRLFIDGELKATINGMNYDICREFFFMSFGKDDCYDNPRFYRDTSIVSNISLFNRTLNDNELKLSSEEDLKNVPGIIALWTFSEVSENICKDKINGIPIFVWEEFKLIKK